MELPPRPMIVHYTLETPWPLAITVFLIGLLVLRHAVNRQNRNAAWASGFILLLAVVLPILAAAVETQSERVRRLTADFIDHVVNADQAKTASLLHDDVELFVASSSSTWDKADIINQVTRVSAIVKSNRIRRVDAVASDQGGRHRAEAILAQTTVTTLGRPVPTEWLFRWVYDESLDEWRIDRITWIRINLNDVPNVNMLGKFRE